MNIRSGDSIFDRALTANAGIFAHRGRLPIVAFVYLAGLAALRLALFPGTSEDDAEQLFYAQAFAWGYKDNQPPLYTWLVIAVERAIGPGLGAVTVVKFASLLAIYVFLAAAAQRILRDPLAAGLAGAAPIALYYVGWDSVLNYSHSVLMMALAALTLLLVARLAERARVVDHVVLGAVVGLGLLAKYNYALFLFGIFAGMLAHPRLRPRILAWPMALALVVALLVVAPHVDWLLAHPPPGPDRGVTLVGITKSLLSAVVAAGVYLLPLLALLPAFFPRAFLRLPPAAPANPWLRFFEAFLVAIAAVIVGSLFVHPAEVRVHWLAVLLPFPLYAFLRAEAAGFARPRLQAFAAALFVLALFVPVGMGAVAAVAPMKCRKCNFQIPYGDLARELRTHGFSGGAVAALDYPNQLAGNLRRYFPETRFVSMRYRGFLPPRRLGAGLCLLIWPTAIEQPGLDTRQSVAALATESFGVRPPRAAAPTRYVDLRVGRDQRAIRIAYVLFEDPGCRQ